MKFGKASYGGNKRTYFKIKDGDNTYRILPPMGDNADKGIWSVFYNVHYGYKNSEGKLRPFQSSLVKNRKPPYMVEVPDAALERITKLKAQLDEAKKAGNGPLVAKLNEFVGPKGAFNLDNNHYVNAIDLQGNIGILKLRHRAKQQLDLQIKKLRENGVDPLDPETGRFFTITRQGMGLDTSFTVSVFSQKLMIEGVGEVQKEVVHKLDEATIGRLATEAADLSKLFKRPSADQIARIVAEGSSAVDEIIDGKGAGAAGSGGSEGDYDDSGDYADEGSQAQSAASVAAPVAQVASAPVATAPVAAKVTAPVVPEVSTVATVTAPAATTETAKAITSMNNDDFLKAYGL